MKRKGAKVVPLVYGPAQWAGYDGVILDAEEAARIQDMSRVSTLGEHAQLIGEPWDEYRDELIERLDEEDESEPSPDDPFDFDEWFNNEFRTWPEGEAWRVAHRRVDELRASDPTLAQALDSGGGSPGGSIDVICGPLEALERVASQVDPARDGFSLERDDALVEAAFPRKFYE